MNGYVLFVLDWTEKKVVSKNRILKFKLAKQSLPHCHKEFLNQQYFHNEEILVMVKYF